MLLIMFFAKLQHRIHCMWFASDAFLTLAYFSAKIHTIPYKRSEHERAHLNTHEQQLLSMKHSTLTTSFAHHICAEAVYSVLWWAFAR